MLGAIIGDIVGSRFEMNNHKSKEFELFNYECEFTDDTAMSIAICKAFLNSKDDFSDLSEKAVSCMQEIGRKYEYVGYGEDFFYWLFEEHPTPYNSWGNGAAMRVSPVAYVANSIEKVKELSKKVTEVTHNHEEALKGAEAVSIAIFMARNKRTKEEIKEYITSNYYKAKETVKELQNSYRFDVSTQGSVPQALQCFYESVDFEDCIKNAISIGGDSDTIAAIAGSIAGAYYIIPENIKNTAMFYLPKEFINVIEEFETKYKYRKDTIK